MEPNDLQAVLDRVDRKKAVLDKRRPFDEALVRRLREYLDVDWTYHSNAIEGNTLTKRETALILNDGITIGGKSVREHLEATNHKSAIVWLHKIADEDRPLDEETLCSLHQIVLRGIDDEWAGRYRCADVFLSGSDHEPPLWTDVPRLMGEFGAWLISPDADLQHPVIRAARTHFRLVHIHPFLDGNGRTARLAMNLSLLKSGYPIAVIPVDERKEYIDALEHGDLTGDTQSFTMFVAAHVDRCAEIYLRALAGINDANREEHGL